MTYGTSTIYIGVTMESTTCPSCHMPFAMPDYAMKQLRQTGKGFTCPNGHNLSFDGEIQTFRSTVDKQKTEIENLKKANATLAAEKAALELAAAKKPAKVEGIVKEYSLPEYKATPRNEYVWTKEEKDKLIALRHGQPSMTWLEIGKAMGKTGSICSSMYNGMKARKQIPTDKAKLDDNAWADIQKMLVAGDTREAIAKKHESKLDEVNAFIEQRQKAGKKDAA